MRSTQIKSGDATCKANQALHDEAVNLVAKVFDDNFYVPAIADPVAPIKFVQKIKVPVYMACQFTDEQTGGHCPDLAQHFTGTAHKWFTFTNGVHTDSLDPATFNRWYDFLELYVAQQAPNMPAAVKAERSDDLPNRSGRRRRHASRRSASGLCRATEAALAAFERLPQVQDPVRQRRRQLDRRGTRCPGSSSRFPASRFPARSARSWYLGQTGGELRDSPPTGQ